MSLSRRSGAFAPDRAPASAKPAASVQGSEITWPAGVDAAKMIKMCDHMAGKFLLASVSSGDDASRAGSLWKSLKLAILDHPMHGRRWLECSHGTELRDLCQAVFPDLFPRAQKAEESAECDLTGRHLMKCVLEAFPGSFRGPMTAEECAAKRMTAGDFPGSDAFPEYEPGDDL